MKSLVAQVEQMTTTQAILVFGVTPLVVLLFLFLYALQLQSNTYIASSVTVNPNMILKTSGFAGEVAVQGHRSIIGTAVVPAGSTSAYIPFSKQFTHSPSISLQQTTTNTFNKFYIEDVTDEGFMLIVDPVQLSKSTFAYNVVDKEATTVSIETAESMTVVVEDRIDDGLRVANF